MDNGPLPNLLEQESGTSWCYKEFVVICVTVLVTEYFLTLGDEVSDIWKAQHKPQNWIYILSFCLNRYLPIANGIIGLTVLFGNRYNEDLLVSATVMLIAFGTIVSQVIIYRRTYIEIHYFFPPVQFIMLRMVTLLILLISLVVIILQYTITLVACGRHGELIVSKQVPFLYTSTCLCEIFVLSLTYINARKAGRYYQNRVFGNGPYTDDGTNDWLIQGPYEGYYEGYDFCVVLILFNAASLVLIHIAQPGNELVIIVLQHILHSVLCNRILLSVMSRSHIGDNKVCNHPLATYGYLDKVPTLPTRYSEADSWESIDEDTHMSNSSRFRNLELCKAWKSVTPEALFAQGRCIESSLLKELTTPVCRRV